MPPHMNPKTPPWVSKIYWWKRWGWRTASHIGAPLRNWEFHSFLSADSGHIFEGDGGSAGTRGADVNDATVEERHGVDSQDLVTLRQWPVSSQWPEQCDVDTQKPKDARTMIGEIISCNTPWVITLHFWLHEGIFVKFPRATPIFFDMFWVRERR